jgi:hypothetical protein
LINFISFWWWFYLLCFEFEKLSFHLSNCIQMYRFQNNFLFELKFLIIKSISKEFLLKGFCWKNSKLLNYFNLCIQRIISMESQMGIKTSFLKRISLDDCFVKNNDVLNYSKTLQTFIFNVLNRIRSALNKKENHCFENIKPKQ